MLRSLIADPEDKRHGQPKPRDEMSADEKRYVDVVAREAEEAHAVRRVKARAERDAFLRAAEAMAAEEGDDTE